MPTKDLSEVKNNIISFLETNGPSLPTSISRHIQTDTIFASAFLSELYSEKRLKITDMKVGSSKIFYLPGQESKLEKFAEEFLKSKEKEAFLILKEKRFLDSEEQEPAIRVALQQIPDFSKPFQEEGKIIFRYFLEDPSNYKKLQIKKEVKEDKSTEEFTPQDKVNSDSGGRDKPQRSGEGGGKPKPKKKTTKKKSVSKAKEEQFFNKVKEFLKEKGKEIEDIINFNKTELILKIKEGDSEKIVIAFNKKRISEIDITKAYKKIADQNLEYILLSLGEPAKKTESLIEAIKKLDSIDKIE